MFPELLILFGSALIMFEMETYQFMQRKNVTTLDDVTTPWYNLYFPMLVMMVYFFSVAVIIVAYRILDKIYSMKRAEIDPDLNQEFSDLD